MAAQITVIISAGQSNNPQKRALESDLATALADRANVRVVAAPNLYDLAPNGQGIDALRALSGDLVVFSWMYERAARWMLDRNQIRGQEGESQLVTELDEDETGEHDSEEEDKERVADSRETPTRWIYCSEFRAVETSATAVQDCVAEIERILSERENSGQEWLAGEGTPEQMERFASPQNETALPLVPQANDNSLPIVNNVVQIEEQGGRRWYPVIDFSRCTNCMECIDFCLFGVYGVDQAETILVEQPDNCRKGCPACSRVCPENAIVFPQHKSPAIAGAPAETGGLKIDLSKLFGAPDGADAAEVAVRERDEQLLLAGRSAVGDSVGLKKRQSDPEQKAPDNLDKLLDELDDLDV